MHVFIYLPDYKRWCAHISECVSEHVTRLPEIS